jgi:hypothetical protein
MSAQGVKENKCFGAIGKLRTSVDVTVSANSSEVLQGIPYSDADESDVVIVSLFKDPNGGATWTSGQITESHFFGVADGSGLISIMVTNSSSSSATVTVNVAVI